MDAIRLESIIKILETNDSNSIKFADTKKALLKDGYTEQEITLALYSYSYDGKPNLVIQKTKFQEACEQNPKLAQEISHTILEDAERHEKMSLIGNVIGLMSRNLPYAARSGSSLKDRLNLPNISFSLLSIVILITAMIYDWPMYIFVMVLAVTFLLLVLVNHKKE